MADTRTDFIELWKAIHGGCWPGPPPDIKLNRAVSELVAGLALYNLSNAFTDAGVGKNVRGLAVESLSKSLPALEKEIRQ
jgi:hypothetical protein